MGLRGVLDVSRPEVFDSGLLDDSRRDVSLCDEGAEPLDGEGIDLVVDIHPTSNRFSAFLAFW